MIFEGKGWVISDKNYGRGTKTISSCAVMSPMLSPKRQEKLIAEQASCLKLVSLVARSLSVFCLYRKKIPD